MAADTPGLHAKVCFQDTFPTELPGQHVFLNGEFQNRHIFKDETLHKF